MVDSCLVSFLQLDLWKERKVVSLDFFVEMAPRWVCIAEK